jgi:CRISPR-associated protein Csm4
LGKHGIGLEETSEIVHSDTLFSAVVSAWAHTCSTDEVSQRVTAYRASVPPAFRLSSAFPYAGDILFYPRPLVELGEAGQRKQAKGVRYVSEQRLRRLVQGDRTLPSDCLVQGGEVLIAAEERALLARLLGLSSRGPEWDRLQRRYVQQGIGARIWHAGEDTLMAHVAVDRLSSASQLYHLGRTHFVEGCGLYFWAEFNDSRYQPLLEAALEYLAFEGLGGKRSAGHGQFEWRAEERSPPFANSPSATYMLLSLYHPTEAEVQAGILRGARYRLVPRGGWVYSPDGRDFRRRTLRMLAEGSVLRSRPEGDISDVTPAETAAGGQLTHRVYRCGVALAIAIGEEV